MARNSIVHLPKARGVQHVLDRARADMDKTGWSNMHVMDQPPYSYTIGFSRTLHHPELIICGIGPETAHGVLNSIGRRLQARPDDDRKPLPVGQPIHQILNVPVVLRQVPRASAIAHAKVACAVLGEDKFELLQIVWPDEHGKFPWDRGWNKAFDATQMALWQD